MNKKYTDQELWEIAERKKDELLNGELNEPILHGQVTGKDIESALKALLTIGDPDKVLEGTTQAVHDALDGSEQLMEEGGVVDVGSLLMGLSAGYIIYAAIIADERMKEKGIDPHEMVRKSKEKQGNSKIKIKNPFL